MLNVKKREENDSHGLILRCGEKAVISERTVFLSRPILCSITQIAVTRRVFCLSQDAEGFMFLGVCVASRPRETTREKLANFVSLC